MKGIFLGSYGFPRSFTTAYSGTVLPASDAGEPPNLWSLYRWHIQDPINFEQELRVTIQALGWGPDGKYKKLSDDIASVAYWYQAEPHAAFPKLPALAERLRDVKPTPVRFPGALECESLEIADRAAGTVAEAQGLSAFGNRWSDAAHLFVQAKKVGDFLEVAIPARDPGARRIVLHATRAPDYGVLRFTINGKATEVNFDGYAEKPTPSEPINLGVHEPKDGKFVLRAEVTGTNPAATGPKYYFGLDAVILDSPPREVAVP